MRRTITVLGIAACAFVAIAVPASAHVEFEPAEAAPGSVVALTLFVEDELPDAGTNRVELVFPEDVPVTLAELPSVDGWVATPSGGEVSGAVTGVVWEGGPEAGDVELPIVLGPLPTAPDRLQFKVLQTYDNGDIDRWIAEWPLGDDEPDNPGPVLDLVEGASGSIPGTTPPTAESSATTAATAAPTTASDETGTAAAGIDNDDDDDDANPLLIGLIVIVVLGAIGGGIVILRRR